MPIKTRIESFFKYFDRYSKSVTMTYRQKGSFDTSCGGIMSIISFFILGWWLATEIVSKFIISPTYAISTKQSLTQESNLDFPLYELESRQFFVTYRMMTSSGIDETELLKYFTPLWIQYSYNKTTNKTEPTFYEAVKCLDTHYIREDDITE